MIFQLLISTSLLCFSATSSGAASPVPSVTAFAQDQTPPKQRHETAWTRESSPEIENWFSQLIALNPGCTVVIIGNGISVSKNGGLVLPPGPVPDGVNLQ